MQPNQKGVALVISLILLLLMMVIGLSAMRSGILEQQMAANERDSELAFQASETALRDAENWIMSQVEEPLPTNDGSNRIWQLDTMDPNTNNAQSWWHERDPAWWNAHGVSYGVLLENINSAPRSLIEYQYFRADDLLVGSGRPPSGTVYYRVTARGTGGSDNAQTLLQSTFAKRY